MGVTGVGETPTARPVWMILRRAKGRLISHACGVSRMPRPYPRHCEERSDEAMPFLRQAAAWIASSLALAMTVGWIQFRVLAARCARGLLVNLVPQEEGAGNAGCLLHPRSRVQRMHKETHTSIQVQTEHIRHSLRKGACGRRKCRQINAVPLLCSHLCRDPMLISLRRETWGICIEAYRALPLRLRAELRRLLAPRRQWRGHPCAISATNPKRKSRTIAYFQISGSMRSPRSG